MVLKINGFDSFLALKGFRYEEKEFFASLEKTVKDFLTSDFENDEKRDLSAELAAQYQSASNFCIKPGHRSYIINLMLEIEKTEASEFFQKVVAEETPSASQLIGGSFTIATNNNDEDSIIISQLEHEEKYEQEVEEYEYEEYLSNDESMDSSGIIGVEFESTSVSPPKQTRESHSASRAGKRRPEHMYNNEFMAKCANPRRRRVALNKNYPNTDEGTRERFRDLLFQVSWETLSQYKENYFRNTFRAWSAFCRGKECPRSKPRISMLRNRKSRTRLGSFIAPSAATAFDSLLFTRTVDAIATTNDQTSRGTCDLNIVRVSSRKLLDKTLFPNSF